MFLKMKSLKRSLYSGGARHEMSDTKMCRKWFSSTLRTEYSVRMSMMPKKKVSLWSSPANPLLAPSFPSAPSLLMPMSRL